MQIPESIQPSIFYVTFAYFIFLILFVIIRVVVFNFALKKIKRPLSMAYDISLFVITTIWFLYLHSQDFIYYSYDSPIILFVGFVYFVSIVDLIYNYFLYKKYNSRVYKLVDFYSYLAKFQGCFHHLSPHRRVSYIQFINKYLKNNGYFSISTFKENGKYGGSTLSDKQYYMDRSLHGGIGYSKEKLKIIFSDFQEIEIRDMQYNNLNHNEFGLEDFIVCLFKKV